MTRKGVWNLQQVRDKYLQSLWVNNAQIWTCGGNNNDYAGVLGNNTGGPSSRYSSPVQVFGDNSEWSEIQIANSSVTMYGKKTDGSLWGWGRGHRGQLGVNNTASYSSPVRVGGSTADNVISYSSCGYTAGWINSDNELWMCGAATFGQLANGKNETTPDNKFSSPVQVPGSWSWISGNNPGHMYGAIKTNGELWVWGGNNGGQLGQNETSPNNGGYSSPVQVPGTTWSKVYCCNNNTKATKTDGSLWVWGTNNQAQLGLNNLVSYSSPIQVPGTWANVKFSKGHGGNRFYVESDGSMYQSGQNYQGNIGNNTRSDNVYYSSPIQIPGNWSTDHRPAIHNNSSVAAIKADGTAWVWGQQQYSGQFGIDSLTNYSSPIQLGGGMGGKWTDVAITQQGFAGIRNTLTSSQE